MITHPSPPDAVVVNDICRRYGRRWALAGVSFQLKRGCSLMIAGRNGSGKSTLLRILAAAIRPDRGEGQVEGADLARDPVSVRRATALLSHASYSYDALTPLENLTVAARLLGLRSAASDLEPLLEEVGLADRARDAVNGFSAGMKRRLSFARVLLQVEAASRPDGGARPVVLLDEPYSQLDPPGFRFVDRLFASFRERGITVIVATHLLERGAAICDEGLVLEAGRVRWSGTAAELPVRGGLDPAGVPEMAQ